MILALPDFGFEQVVFDLIVPRALNRMEGRRTEGLLHGTPFWRAEYRTGWLDFRRYGQADAFIRSLHSRDAVFRGHDLFRPRPIEWMISNPNQPFAVGGFDGTANLATITDARTVTVTGVPPDFQFRRGDYVEFAMSAIVISLHSLASDALADGSGEVALSIDPALDTQHFTTSATVNFEKPACLMQPFEWEGPKAQRQRRPSWSAEEVFRYEAEED